MTFTECRIAWRKDWLAMKAGTYEAPLPHPQLMAYEPDKTRSAVMRQLHANGLIPRRVRNANTALNGYGKTE